MGKSNQRLNEAEIEITMRCNLNCAGCYKWDPRLIGRELLVENWKKAIDNLENCGIMLVNLIGGEPTIFPKIEELIAYINSKPRIDYLLSTNGLITESILLRLLKVGLKNVIVSVDGIFKKSEIQEKKYEDRVYKSIVGLQLLRRLKKKGIEELSANFTVIRDNIDQILPTYEVLVNEGFWFNLIPLQFLKYGLSEEYPIRLVDADRHKMAGILEKLMAIKKKPGNKIVNSVVFLRHFADFAIKQNFKCRELRMLGITRNGKITYCVGQDGEIGKSEKFDVLTLTPKKLKELLSWWSKDKIGGVCPGCTFTCRDRTNDFEYLEKPGDEKYRNFWFRYKQKLKDTPGVKGK